jgi:hypothetical protein
MRRVLLLLGVLSVAVAAMVFSVRGLVAQQTPVPAAPPRHPSPATMSQAMLDEMLIRFPLPPGRKRTPTSTVDGCTNTSLAGEHRPEVPRSGPPEILGPDHRHLR